MPNHVSVLLALLLATQVRSQDWNLSGKIVDAEEGNGLKDVTVSLAQAGYRATSAKNGDWSIVSATGAHRFAREGGTTPSFLHVAQGRIALGMNGRDLLGRGTDAFSSPPPRSLAAREAAGIVDTLVFEREGYITRRVPLTSPSLADMRDSIRRIRYAGWVDSSHANVKADTLSAFTRGFRHITFRWTKRSWDHMMKVMTDSCGAFGTKADGWGMGGTSKDCKVGQYDLIEKAALVWVPVDIESDGQIWRDVGIRMKGNASLQTAWTSGSHALPFRINTDKFEDSLPLTKDQRFHGFKKIGFFNLQQDTTGIRGAVAGEIFRQFGIPAPISVPVRITLKFGDTTKEVGVYEMLEIPDAPFLKRNFGNSSGNLYKPLSKLDQFVESEWADDDVPGNRDDAKDLINTINSPLRTTNATQWKQSLERIIDVQGFLRWLAASTAIMNWDAYGSLAHNYYLYSDSGSFRFITYDFGWSFDYQMAQVGIVSRTSVWYDGTAGGMMNLGPFPLVKNLLADRDYCESYRRYMTEVIAGPASVASFQAKVDKYASWIASTNPNAAKIQALRGFMGGRIPEIQASLNSKTCPIR